MEARKTLDRTCVLFSTIFVAKVRLLCNNVTRFIFPLSPMYLFSASWWLGTLSLFILGQVCPIQRFPTFLRFYHVFILSSPEDISLRPRQLSSGIFLTNCEAEEEPISHQDLENFTKTSVRTCHRRPWSYLHRSTHRYFHSLLFVCLLHIKRSANYKVCNGRCPNMRGKVDIEAVDGLFLPVCGSATTS